MFVEVSVLILFGNGFKRSKIDHIQCAHRNNFGDSGFGSSFQSGWPSREDAASHLIAPFGGGRIENAFDKAGFNQTFHGHAPGSGGVEHQDLVALIFQIFSGRGNTGRGNSKHRRSNQRFFFLKRWNIKAGHPGDGIGGISQNMIGYTVDAGNIHH